MSEVLAFLYLYTARLIYRVFGIFITTNEIVEGIVSLGG